MSEFELELLLNDERRQVQARATLRSLLDAAPRTLTYKHWLSRLPPADEQDSRLVALLSSFTLETIEPFLQVEAYLSGFRVQTSYVQYGQWQNALLNPAGLGVHHAAAAVLLVHDAELLGDDFSTPVEDALARLFALLTAWRASTGKPLFLCVVQAPPPSHGLAFGDCTGRGIARKRVDFLAGVVDRIASIKDLYLIGLQDTDLRVVDWFDARAYLAIRTVFSHRALPGVARVLARHLACLFRPRRKLLVLDMDNTLWGGIVGEDGISGLILGQDYPGRAYLDFQRTALALRSTGVLLALASKNNDVDAMEVFAQRPEMLLKPADFSARRINWQDKAGNIAQIAHELGLGLDSLVFADDSPIECALVREALPQVEVVELGKEPADFADRLLRTQAFDTLHVSEEDSRRADSYAAEANRQQLRSSVTDLASFLADCDLRLVLKPVNATTLDRVHQLLGKTNQFNFSLQRLSKESLQMWMNLGQSLYSASLTDRFGDYGLVGVLHLQRGEGDFEITNMALSCRALGRGVEDAMLAYARVVARQMGCNRLTVRAVRGPRNQQVLEYLDNAGFSRVSEDSGSVLFAIAVDNDQLPWPVHVAVQLEEIESN